MDAFWVDMFCFGDKPCQLSFRKRYDGGERRYNAAQEHKQAQTKIDTARHCPRIYRPLAGMFTVQTMGMMVDHQVVVAMMAVRLQCLAGLLAAAAKQLLLLCTTVLI